MRKIARGWRVNIECNRAAEEGNARIGVMKRTPPAGQGALTYVGLLPIYRVDPASVTTRTAATTARALTVLSFVHFQGATLKVGAVQSLHGAGCVGVGHLDKAEATRTTGVAVADQGYLFNRAVLGKQGTHGFIGRGKGQISYI